MKRAVHEDELSATARSLVKAADHAGYWTSCVVVSCCDEGPSWLIRGRKGELRFAAVFIDGKVETAYWWTREHSGRVERDMETTASVGGDVAEWKRAHAGKISAQRERELRARAYEEVRWTSKSPTPVRFGIRELIAKIKASSDDAKLPKGGEE